MAQEFDEEWKIVLSFFLTQSLLDANVPFLYLLKRQKLVVFIGAFSGSRLGILGWIGVIWRIKSNYLSVYGTGVWWRMKNCFKLFPNAKLAWRQCSISIPSQTTETCCFYWCFQWVQTGNTGVNWGDMKNQKQLFKCLWHKSLIKNEKLF